MKTISTILIAMASLVYSCTKPENSDNTQNAIKSQVDPETAKTVGFFLENWTPKNYTVPAAFTESDMPDATTSTVTIDYAKVIAKIPESIYGNNANQWSGKMVTDNTLVDHISKLKPNIIRFPGGSISDVYFWNAENNTPQNTPATLKKANGEDEPSNFWYGKNNADWTISLNNYYELLQATDSKGIITVNYGYARYGTGANPVQDAAKLAADWVTYDNGRTKYWEIGNENFGDWEAGYRINTATNQDGQPEFMNGQLYAQHFNIIAQAMRTAAAAIGTDIKIGAVMFETHPETWMNDNNKTWNDKMLPAIQENADFYVVHSYFTTATNANAQQILASPKAKIEEIMPFVQSELSAKGKQIKPFALDEWNIFATGSKQQVSQVNGMHAVMILGEAIKNNIGMSSRWDFFNGWNNGDDHGMFSNGDEPNIPKGTPRPAFYHMYYFQKNMGDRLIEAVKDANGDYEVYASSFSDGKIGLAFVNKATTPINVKLKFNNFLAGKRMYWYRLTGDTDNGEFSRKVIINGSTSTLEAGGPDNYATIKPYSATTAKGTNVNLPARASVFVVIEKK